MTLKKFENEVDKYLKDQAEMDQKKDNIVNWFNEQFSKSEVTYLVNFLLLNGANIYEEELNAFKEHYESKNKDVFTVKDIKSFLTITKVYKGQLKEQQTGDLLTSQSNELNQNENAEEKDE